MCSIGIVPSAPLVLHLVLYRYYTPKPEGHLEGRGEIAMSEVMWYLMHPNSQLGAVYDHSLIYYGSVKTIASLVMRENACCAL